MTHDEIKTSKDLEKWIAKRTAAGELPFDLGVKATAVLWEMRNIETLRRRRKTVDVRTMRIFSDHVAAFTKARASTGLIASLPKRSGE
jgi:hypothetical protein